MTQWEFSKHNYKHGAKSRKNVYYSSVKNIDVQTDLTRAENRHKQSLKKKAKPGRTLGFAGAHATKSKDTALTSLHERNLSLAVHCESSKQLCAHGSHHDANISGFHDGLGAGGVCVCCRRDCLVGDKQEGGYMEQFCRDFVKHAGN